jgi:hypothetical protein
MLDAVRSINRSTFSALVHILASRSSLLSSLTRAETSALLHYFALRLRRASIIRACGRPLASQCQDTSSIEERALARSALRVRVTR